MPSQKIERVYHKFLGEDEAKFFEDEKYAVDLTRKMNDLTLLWSCKEAVFKWYGDGGVDFKKHIHLKFDDLSKDEGYMHCHFVKNELVELDLYYKKINKLWLAWII